MSQEKKERNEQIYKLWKEGYGTISDVARKFELQPEVVWRIIKRYAKMEATNAT
jgi:Mor family transcriptional regulator